jgi:hypothetical protein
MGVILPEEICYSYNFIYIAAGSPAASHFFASPKK